LKKSASNRSLWPIFRRVRQAVQAAAFVLFLSLLLAGLHEQAASPLADIFFRLNPLSAAAAMLASRSWLPRLGLALITVVVTVLLGRVWCGWICPMGTLLEWTAFRSARRRARKLPEALRGIKYGLLLIILALAVFGSLTLTILDPLALITRSFTAALLPALNYAITAAEKTLYLLPVFQPAVDAFETALRGPLLPVKPPAFNGSLAIAALLGLIVGLNLLADRFWCRYLCPLGGLLGWLAKFSLLRPVIGSACTQCSRCAAACRPGAVFTQMENGKPAELSISPAECTVCLDCLTRCPNEDIHFQAGLNPAWKKPAGFDPGRRQALGTLAASAAGAALLKADLRLRQRSSQLIRPPGVQDETAFLSACLRCSQCIKVCPTSALQPALNEAGVEGLWTPVVMPRVGYCDYGCTACGQVCPSQAIPLLSLAEKRQAVIGKASVDRSRCLPWSAATPCIVCEEMCPTPEKSIRLEEATMTNSQGEELLLQRPVVMRDLCIGCGICENHCPLEGAAAIHVNTYYEKGRI
jgi:polyferredoxin